MFGLSKKSKADDLPALPADITALRDRVMALDEAIKANTRKRREVKADGLRLTAEYEAARAELSAAIKHLKSV